MRILGIGAAILLIVVILPSVTAAPSTGVGPWFPELYPPLPPTVIPAPPPRPTPPDPIVCINMEDPY